MSPRMRLAVAAIVVAAAWVPGGDAQAGTYTVEACQSARQWSYGSDAFEFDRSTRLLGLNRNCGPWGRIGREPGLSTIAGRERGRVGEGAFARAIFRAPAGMRIERVEWSGLLKRCDSDWKAGVAVSGDGPARWVMLPGDNRFSPDCKDNAHRSAAPPPAALSRVAGATAIYSQVKCASRDGCALSALPHNEVRADARTFAARITLNDPTPPVVQNVGGELTSGRWLNGRRELLFATRDGSGISLEDVVSPSGTLGQNPRTCDPTQRVPCPPTGTGRIVADTTNTVDGAQTLTLNVHDATGQSKSISFPARIDNHPPGQVAVTVAGGEGWQRSGPFAVAWQNPPEPAAPINGVYYQLRRAGGATWTTPVLEPGAEIARLGVPVGRVGAAPVARGRSRKRRRGAGLSPGTPALRPRGARAGL